MEVDLHWSVFKTCIYGVKGYSCKPSICLKGKLQEPKNQDLHQLSRYVIMLSDSFNPNVGILTHVAPDKPDHTA
jgi:hypothetical protein